MPKCFFSDPFLLLIPVWSYELLETIWSAFTFMFILVGIDHYFQATQVFPVKISAVASGSCLVDNTSRKTVVPQAAMVKLWATDTSTEKSLFW